MVLLIKSTVPLMAENGVCMHAVIISPLHNLDLSLPNLIISVLGKAGSTSSSCMRTWQDLIHVQGVFRKYFPIQGLLRKVSTNHTARLSEYDIKCTLVQFLLFSDNTLCAHFCAQRKLWKPAQRKETFNIFRTPCIFQDSKPVNIGIDSWSKIDLYRRPQPDRKSVV